MAINDCIGKSGFQAVKESSLVVEVKCPNCGDELMKNGQRKLTEQTVHNHKCMNEDCGRQRTFPTQSEFERMEHHHQSNESHSCME